MLFTVISPIVPIHQDGATALKLACMEGLLEMVKLLVDRGAEINAVILLFDVLYGVPF